MGTSATFCTATYAKSGHCLSSGGVWGPHVPAGSTTAAILAAGDEHPSSIYMYPTISSSMLNLPIELVLLLMVEFHRNRILID